MGGDIWHLTSRREFRYNSSIKRQRTKKEVFVMKNEKKDNSNVLMVVGVIFILLAGGICVSKAWDYLPLAAKQACLFGVAMFGLGSSFVLFSKDRLHKTESALFYIGNAFLGYFFLSVMDSVYSEDVFGIWEKSFVISLVLFITVAIKLAVKKEKWLLFLMIIICQYLKT